MTPGKTKRQKLRVLIVDDSRLYQQVLKRVVAGLPDTEVVAMASNGNIALQKLSSIEVDVLTLDVEMPGMDGLQTLERMKDLGLSQDVVMVSSLTGESTDATLRALELGAHDFVTKPSASSAQENERLLAAQLAPIFFSLKTKSLLRRVQRGDHAAPRGAAAGAALRQKKGSPVATSRRVRVSGRGEASEEARRGPFEVIAIGISTGGPAALSRMIPSLPASLPLPLVMVQHMPPHFTASLARSLDRKSQISVVEAVDGMPLIPGRLHIAPGGSQLRVLGPSHRASLQVTDDPPENNCKPAVDYLFRSLAEIFGGKVLAVIMTGMGSDGVEGLRLLKAQGAYALAQDAESCVVNGMPGEARSAGVIDEVLSLDALAARIAILSRTTDSAPRA